MSFVSVALQPDDCGLGNAADGPCPQPWWWCRCLKPLVDQSKRRRSSNNLRLHLSRWHRQAWRRSRQRHQESPQQGQTSLQNATQLVAQHQDQELRLYQSCIFSTLLYGSECWRKTESDLNKLSTFHTKNLRRILRIFWPETISN